jgi:hypothetical protein
MKTTLLQAVLFTACCCIGSRMMAGTIETISIDEHGNFTWVDTFSVSHSFKVSALSVDPSGGTTQALVYNTGTVGFSFSVRGDYRIMKPGTEEVVGVVRFYEDNQIIFYDNDPGPGGSLADGSGLPPTYYLRQVVLDETPVGGSGTGLIVIPEDSEMPGFTDGNRQYTFLTSLPVPEPGVFALLACGAALVGLRRKKPVR